MAESMFADDEGNEDASSRRPTFLTLLPGGKRPGSVEMMTGLLVLAALGYLVLVRRGFRGVLNR